MPMMITAVLVILLPVAALKGSGVFYSALYRAARHGVIRNGTGKYITGRSMLHNTVPWSIAALDWLHSTGIFPLRAGEAYTGQAAVIGKGDATVGIVPGIMRRIASAQAASRSCTDMEPGTFSTSINEEKADRSFLRLSISTAESL